MVFLALKRDLRGFPSPCLFPLSSLAVTLEVRNFAPGPPRRSIGRRLTRQSIVLSSGLRATRCIRPSLFLDNRPCIARLRICLGAEAEGEGVALADGFCIISEPRKAGYMNDQIVSAAIRISQRLIDHKS